VAVLGALLVATSANAHQGLLAGTRPYLDEAGALVGGSSTWGIVLEEDGRWLRVCEESFRTRPSFSYRVADGRILLGGDDGLYVTDDGGCTYASVSDALDGHVVSALAAPSEHPEILFVATSTAGRDNGLFISRDAGLTFAATSLSLPERMFSRVAVSDDGARLYASALHTADGASLVFASDDGGETFVEHRLSGYVRVKVLGVDVDGESAVLAGDTAAGPSDLLVADPAFEAVRTVGTFDESIPYYAAFGGVRYVVLNTSLYRETDAGFAPVPGGPTNCLLTSPSGDALWGCGQLLDLGHFLSSSDGETFDVHIPFGLVEERQCPEGTAGWSFCPQNPFADAGIEVPVDAGGLGTDGGGELPPEGQCSCGGASEGPPPWREVLGFALFAWAVRLGGGRWALARRRIGR